MIDLFIPEIPKIPSPQEQAQATANEIARVLTARMIRFDAELVSVLAIIADALCRAGCLERQRLHEQFDALHQAHKTELTGEYSPLSLLVSVFRQMGDNFPPEGKEKVAWLREVIEGGLSKRD